MAHTSKEQAIALIDDVFSAFNDSSVRFCLVRNFRKLSTGLNGKDIDILVHPNDVELVEQTIRQLPKYFVCGFFKNSFLVDYFLTLDSPQSPTVEFDMSFAITWRGLKLLDVQKIISDACSTENVSDHAIVAPKEAINLINFLNVHFNKTQFSLEKISPFFELGDRKNAVIERYSSNISVQFILKSLTNHQHPEDYVRAKIKHFFIKVYLASLIIISPQNLKGFFASVFEEIKVRHLQKYRKTLVFLGPDGSGKSTLIKTLKLKLMENNHRTEIRHLKPSIYFKRRHSDRGVVRNPHGKSPRSALITTAKLLAYSSEFWLGRLLDRAHLVDVILYDRHAQDYCLDPQRYRIPDEYKFTSFFSNFAPKADLYVVLTGNPSIINARKREVTLLETEKQTKAYEAFSAKTPNSILIDTSRPKNVCVEQIYRAVLMLYNARD